MTTTEQPQISQSQRGILLTLYVSGPLHRRDIALRTPGTRAPYKDLVRLARLGYVTTDAAHPVSSGALNFDYIGATWSILQAGAELVR